MRNNNRKYLIWVIGIFALIFIAGTAWFFVSYHEPVGISSGAGVSNQAISSTEKNSADNKVVQKTADKIATNNLIKIALAAGNEKYDISVPKGASVYDAMAILSSTTKKFSFSSKYHSGLGYFIEAINGIKNASGNYWTLYVNGKYATVGVSGYTLSVGDRIEWKYTNEANY